MRDRSGRSHSANSYGLLASIEHCRVLNLRARMRVEDSTMRRRVEEKIPERQARNDDRRDEPHDRFTGSLPRTVLGRSHVSSPASSRLSYGPGFAVDEVVHDHEIAGGSMVAVRHVGCLRTERSVSRSDVDRRHERRRELDADE